MHDYFENLKINLEKNKKSEDTIKTYFHAFKKFEDSKLNIFDYAKTLKNRNLVSQFINALKYSNYKLDLKDKKILKSIHDNKPSRRAKPREQFKAKSFFNRINACKNMRAKLSFRLSVLAGLRIKELSDLRKEDVTFLDDGRIKIYVRAGKGNKERIVTTIMYDKYVRENLKELLDHKDDAEKVFYSRNYLHQIAKKYDFQNHDLRKMCLQKVFYGCYEDKETTIELIQAYAGHEKGNTYKYYLSRDINAYGTKFDI